MRSKFKPLTSEQAIERIAGIITGMWPEERVRLTPEREAEIQEVIDFLEPGDFDSSDYAIQELLWELHAVRDERDQLRSDASLEAWYGSGD